MLYGFDYVGSGGFIGGLGKRSSGLLSSNYTVDKVCLGVRGRYQVASLDVFGVLFSMMSPVGLVSVLLLVI